MWTWFPFNLRKISRIYRTLAVTHPPHRQKRVKVHKFRKGEKTYHIFGSYQNGPIRNVSTYQGDVTGFMFSIHPTIKFFTTDKG